MKKILAWLKPYFSILLFLVPVAIGGALLLWAASNRKANEKLPEQELARTLRVIKVQPTTVIPRAIGFGESGASKSFQAVAEVKGKIIELHPELKSGSFVRKGELLVAIDQKDIEITIQKLKAEIARSEASVKELETNEKNLKAAIAIEQNSLKLANKDLERMEKLSKSSGALSASEVDAQRRTVLGQQQAVQNLQSSLNLLPVQIKSGEASIAVSKANLASSERDLERCRIVAPFNCRLGSVDLDINEVVAVGQQLFSAQSIDKIEVEAQLGLDKLANLVRREQKAPDITENLKVNPQEVLRKFFDVEVVLRYGAGEIRTSRKAKFERLREQLDAQARTIGIVVSIDNPYQREGSAKDAGPPPLPGTYCEVELRGKPIQGAYVVPRSAIREGSVFLVDQEDRLRKCKVEVQLVQKNFASIKGLQPGDRVVVSDPTPAIEGMLVDPRLDNDLAESLKTEAEGDN